MDRVVSMDPAYHWNSQKHGPYTVHSIGREKTIQRFLSLLPESGPLDKETLTRGLVGLKGNFAAIVKAPDFALAVADKIRAYPVFYADGGKGLRVSNSARLLKKELGLSEVDELSLLEVRTSGYVTGRETLYNNLYQLQAGEFLVWDKKEDRLDRERYYLFYSDKVREKKEDDFIQELDEATNTIIQRNMDDAAGRPICVPLSGGLDSRLVLCKLKQLGYDNLSAFSYGPPGNYEAKAAGYVTEKLDVPWTFVPSLRKDFREFFKSKERKKYWEFADGLYLPPSLHTICALRSLIVSKRLSKNSILINGQSGDFIAGQHIPDLKGQRPGYDVLLERIIKKHFSHRADLAHRANREKISKKILTVLQPLVSGEITDYESFAKQYELWEWQERQCKRVVAGQRNYDFLGLSWELPLWDLEYLEFWMEIPVPLRIKRTLFVNYVEKMDLYGLFKNYKPKLSRWPGHKIWIQYIGKVVHALLGKGISSSYYAYLDYFGQYSYLYSIISYWKYIQKCGAFKSPMSHHNEIWLKENNVLSN